MLREGRNSLAIDPHRDAGAALVAGRPVGDRLAAAEAAMGQQVVEVAGACSPTRCVNTLRSCRPGR